jgi:hypothetical protein
MVCPEEKKKKIILDAINKNTFIDKIIQNFYTNTFFYFTMIFVLAAFAYIIILVNTSTD